MLITLLAWNQTRHQNHIIRYKLHRHVQCCFCCLSCETIFLLKKADTDRNMTVILFLSKFFYKKYPNKHKLITQCLAQIHALWGAKATPLPSLDALVDGCHVSVGSDLVGEVGHAGAPLDLRHGQQGGDSAHGRAPQLLLLLKLLLHRPGLHLQVVSGWRFNHTDQNNTEFLSQSFLPPSSPPNS